MTTQLAALAASLEEKASKARDEAEAMTTVALEADNQTRLHLATHAALKATIYREVAESIRAALAD